MSERNITENIPDLVATGVTIKHCIFLEIARHPNGLCVRDLMMMFGENKATVWNYIRPMVEANLITGRKMKRDNIRARYFKATAFGIDRVACQMNSCVKMLCARRAEMIEEGMIR